MSSPAVRLGKFHFLSGALILTVLGFSTLAAQAKTAALKKGPVGIIYLVPHNNPKVPLSDLESMGCWTNPEVKGVLIRLTWEDVEPGDGQFDFSVFDNAVKLAKQYGKFVGIGVCAGKKTPEWVYASGAKKFFFSRKKNKGELFMPEPWDPAFQSKWNGLIQAMGHRYDSSPEVAYVVMSGPGRDFETFYVDTPDDVAAFNEAGGQKLWGHAAETIASFYVKAFPHTTLIYGMGPPTPTDEGHATIEGVITDLLKAYPQQFGICNASLAPVYNPHSSGIFIKDNSAKTSVGFQTLLPSKGGERMKSGTLGQALQNGVDYKAHYIEVYRVDCDDPSQQGALHNANQGLNKNAQALLKNQ